MTSFLGIKEFLLASLMVEAALAEQTGKTVAASTATNEMSSCCCRLNLDLAEFSVHPTEPANYRGSYTTGSKETVDIEIAMCRNTGIGTTTIIASCLESMVTTMGLLLKLTGCEEKEEI